MSKKDDKKKQTPQPAPEEAPQADTQTPAPEEAAAPEEKTEEAKQDAPKEEAAAQTAELEKKLAEAGDKYMRMLAEYDNYRRRSQKERETIYADVRADTVIKFLPVYDNLARAVQNETDEATRKGVEAIFTQFKTILTGLGVVEIDAVGKKFDPSLHEALLHIEDEKYGEGEIVLELEKGFKLGDRVIRFAKVQVAN